MLGLHDAKDQQQEIYNNQPQQGRWTHEAVGGAAAFEAMHMWENEQRKKGQPMSHDKAKEALAAIAGAEVDKLFEKKGMNFLQRQRVKKEAQDDAKHFYDEQYAGMDNYNPSTTRLHQDLQY